MIRRPYALEGKNVPASLQGKVVMIRVAENQSDRLALATDEAGINSLFNKDYAIWLQGALRSQAGKTDKDGKLVNSLESLQAFADGEDGVYSVRGEGKPRESKPATQARREEAELGNQLYELCASDPKELAKFVRLGLVKEDKFNAWKTARDAAAMAAKIDAAQAAAPTA